MPRPPEPLPIDDVLPEIATALLRHPAVVVRAPTGAGKTTRVPPALAAAGVGGGRRIVMLEPRRVAARAAARRMAEENGWHLGGEVGYQVRFERCFGEETRILVVTEGILVRMLQDDPFLDGIGTVIFDELHERALTTDLALAMARRVQRQARDDLKLVAMSATLETGPVAAYLGGCPVVDSAGRLYPVEVRYLPAPSRLAPRETGSTPRALAARATAGVRRALAETAGSVLAFLPGVGEIRRTAVQLADLAAEGIDVLPLYGDLPARDQDAVLAPAARRRVVLATNVAETSVTVPGVTAVVDTGYARQLSYDPATGLDRLRRVPISHAAADQRAGRAGRDSPGVAFRLWDEHEHRGRPARETPEIARVDLAAPALQLLAWGETNLAAFDWLEPPDPAALERALTLLRRLGAVGGHGLTPLGRQLARFPLHPRLARLLTEGHRRGALAEAALAAALLAERDPFHRPRPGDPPPPPSRSDLGDRVEALERFAATGRPGADRELRKGASHFSLRAAEQLARRARAELGEPAPRASDPREALERAVFAAFSDRLARRREPGSRRGVMVGGRGVVLAPASAVVEPELFVCLEVDAGTRGVHAEALVRQASAVEPEWLAEEDLETVVEVAFDAARERVVAYRRRRFEDLVIAETEVPAPPADAARVLAEAAATDPSRTLPLAEPAVASFLARVRWLRKERPELALPVFDEEDLRRLLPALAAGRRSFAELRRAPLLDALKGTLSRRQLAALEREAPERLEVPGGSRIRLAYRPGEPPVLAVKIQELYGLTETPRLAGGRVPVLLHLLAPNGRPQQVTRDLAGFWRRTYPEVKKELAGRYPKHAWPEDPAAARPERRPRRRRR